MSASAPLSSRPASQRCFLDGLALCFGMLDLTDFLSAVVACRHWRVASLHVPSIGFELHNVARKSQTEEETESRWTPATRLLNLVSSPYRIHISKLDDLAKYVWNLADLRLIHRLSHLTHIRGLTIDLAHFSGQREAFYDFAFPGTLQSASLVFIFPPQPADAEEAAEQPEVNLVLLPALVGCPNLTELSLRAVPSPDSDSLAECPWDLSILTELRQLKILRLVGSERGQFRAKDMQVLQRCECLERLKIEPQWSYGFQQTPGWLLPLCTPPHSLQRLSELELSYTWTLASHHLRALLSLPALTAFEPRVVTLPSLPVLANFPNLLRASIWPAMRADIDEPLSQEMQDALVQSEGPDPRELVKASFVLQFLTCSRLHTLELCQLVFEDGDLADMCRLLPAITSLHLTDCEIPSFDALPKLSQLRSLVFQSMSSYQAPFNAKIEHIIACKSLTTLRLICCLFEDVQRLAPLNVPSAVMPWLKQFTH